jgi:uncharacterized protein YcbK (DUF882 family)
MLSQHFARSEFACPCGCGFNTVDAELIAILEAARAHFMVPITINSGCRCEKHNQTLPNSARSSQHLRGKAADIRVAGWAPDLVADYLEQIYPNSYGIGRYNTFTHIDVRDGKSRWNFSK